MPERVEGSLKVVSVEPRSIAESLNIKEGDTVVEINGEPLRDIIDYKFHSSDDLLEITLQRDGQLIEVEAHKPFDSDLGISFDDLEIKQCRNKCVFCFIHQMPRGMRQSLYIEDDDYRLSFLHGAYITLTNLSEEDFDRIIEQRLNPIYVSVHTTDPELRLKMLGRKKSADVIEAISKLIEHDIEIHTQVVLCPGYNDGHHLERTINDLSQFYPNVKSIAIVPVGLTKYREHLTPLVSLDSSTAKEYIRRELEWHERFGRQFECKFVYLADEFYLLAGHNIPAYQHYDDFPQVENGVGMTRRFLDDFYSGLDELANLADPIDITLVTGEICVSFLEEVVAELNRHHRISADLIPVENRFFGGNISVSGLLTGGDIVDQLKDKSLRSTVLLPPNCANHDGVLLDDMTPQDISQKLGKEVIVGDYDILFALSKIVQTM